MRSEDSGIERSPRIGDRIIDKSAQPDEGKTFSTINLALSLAAEKDVSVLLIDGDFFVFVFPILESHVASVVQLPFSMLD